MTVSMRFAPMDGSRQDDFSHLDVSPLEALLLVICHEYIIDIIRIKIFFKNCSVSFSFPYKFKILVETYMNMLRLGAKRLAL